MIMKEEEEGSQERKREEKERRKEKKKKKKEKRSEKDKERERKKKNLEEKDGSNPQARPADSPTRAADPWAGQLGRSNSRASQLRRSNPILPLFA